MRTPKVVYLKGKTHFLDIGDVAFLEDSGSAITALGSCVSVCLFSVQHRVCSVCHAQLSTKAVDMRPDTSIKKSVFSLVEKDTSENRYVDSVVQFMINSLSDKGVKRGFLKALVVGAASIIPLLQKRFTVGENNAISAMQVLNSNGIEVVYKDLGGNLSRKLEVYNKTGLVYVNRKLVYNLWTQS